MNNKILIGIVAAVILLGGGFFVLSSKKTPEVVPTTQTPASTEQPSAMQSLKDLLTAGRTVRCSFSDTTESSSVSGTSYVANGKVRVDTTSTAQGQTMGTHMIMDNQTNYIWMDNSKTGFKMNLDAAKPSGSPAQGQQSLDTEKKLDYNCEAWSVDQSLFVVPTDVKFQDMNAMMAPAKSGAPAASGSKADCSACDSAPESARAQCKAALGC